MSRSYRHLKEQDQIFLSQMLMKGYRKDKIAEILGVDRSTIYREIKRNIYIANYSEKKLYHSWYAQNKYIERRKRHLKLVKDKTLRGEIESKLALGWSPWQIEGRLRREHGGKSIISHESIYRYIYSEAFIRNQFYKKLRRKHFWRVKRHKRNHRVPQEMLINYRPNEIHQRHEFGHWECDLMMFKRGMKGNLITLRERKTRYMIAIKNENKTAFTTALTLISMMTKLKNKIKSITFDQGSEFIKYQWIKNCIGADIYFCEPASPYQKGSIENGNGVIRVELQRDYNVEELKQKDVNNIIRNINERPLKCLDYQTPAELFNKY